MVLEYGWCETRDLIEQVQCQVESLGSHESHSGQLIFRSVVSALAEVGFDLDPAQRLSYFKPSHKLYVYLGKVAELATGELRLTAESLVGG